MWIFLITDPVLDVLSSPPGTHTPRTCPLVHPVDSHPPAQSDVRSSELGSRPSPPYNKGFTYRPVRPNRCGPVPVYRSGLAGNRSVPVEFKFRSTTGLPVGLTSNRSNSGLNSNARKVYYMNVCITCFSLNEPSNSFLYYFYIVFVYFYMHAFFV